MQRMNTYKREVEYLAYHLQKDDRQDGVDGEKPGHHHHDHGHGQVSPQHADGGDPAAVDNRQNKLI